MNQQDFKDYKQAQADGDEKQAKKLRDKLVKDNFPLISRMATKYKNGLPYQIEWEDLIQIGQIAMLRTLDSLDTSKGHLSTYFAYWFRDRIKAARKDYSFIHKPGYWDDTKDVAQAKSVFQAIHGRVPTPEDLGLDPNKEKQVHKRFFTDSIHNQNREGISYEEILPGHEPSPEEEAALGEEKASLRLLLAELDSVAISIVLTDATDKELAKKHNLKVKEIQEIRVATIEALRKGMEEKGHGLESTYSV